MNKFFKIIMLTGLAIFANNISAQTLSEDAIERGISETCSKYLNQIESSYDLIGLNITFAHKENPSLYPSLHVSSKNYNNGSSIFSATLTPDSDYCYLSTVYVTTLNNQSCSEITDLKLQENPQLKLSTFAEGAYTIITPSDNSYQIMLTTSGESGCSMTEIRMLWPGR